MGLLFSGDHILNGSTTVIDPPDGNMHDYLTSLDTERGVRRTASASSCPPTGGVLGNAPLAIEQLRQHRLKREAKVLAAMRTLPHGSLHDWVRHACADVPLNACGSVAERSLLAHVQRIRTLELARPTHRPQTPATPSGHPAARRIRGAPPATPPARDSAPYHALHSARHHSVRATARMRDPTGSVIPTRCTPRSAPGTTGPARPPRPPPEHAAQHTRKPHHRQAHASARPPSRWTHPTAVRLAKRVMEEAACSRAQAEQLIEGGRVRVNGKVVQDPPTRVEPRDRVEVQGTETAARLAPATLLLHKPSALTTQAMPLTEASHQPNDRSGLQLLKKHLSGLVSSPPGARRQRPGGGAHPGISRKLRKMPAPSSTKPWPPCAAPSTPGPCASSTPRR